MYSEEWPVRRAWDMDFLRPVLLRINGGREAVFR
jgi:hypothetical protein